MYKWTKVTTQLWRVTNILTNSTIYVVPHHYTNTQSLFNYITEATN